MTKSTSTPPFTEEFLDYCTSEDGRRVIQYCIDNPTKMNKEIAEAFGFSVKKVRNIKERTRKRYFEVMHSELSSLTEASQDAREENIFDCYTPFARSELQRSVLCELASGVSVEQAAKSLSMSANEVLYTIEAIKRYAAIRGFSPEHDMTHVTSETQAVKGISTLYGANGEQKLQWVKTNVSLEQQLEALKEVVNALKESVPKVKSTKSTRTFSANAKKLLNTYVITDYHMGQLSWGEETRGEDWDIKKAEKLLIDWFDAAIQIAPDSEQCVFAQLGDFLHWDGMNAVTPTHGHLLDADTRFQKLVRVAIRTVTNVVDILLKKHKYVHLVMATGNHDLSSSVWLREMMQHYYSNHSRVTVDVSPDPYYCFEHGKTSLFFHHGHKRKPGNISAVFVSKFREVFGRTTYSYAHMGHMHHIDIKENEMMVVEQHRTLAAADAHSSSGGWHSGRSANVITYHSDFGEVSRLSIKPEMLEQKEK